MNKKIISLIIKFYLILFVLTGCAEKNSLKPLVPNCCIKNEMTKKVDKTIYIGHFNIENKDNKLGVFGKKNYLLDNKSITDIKFEESIDLIIREEFKRRLSNIFTNVILLDTKSSQITNDDVYLNGTLKKIWINQKYVNSFAEKDFNFTNTYLFEIETNLNGKKILDNKNAKLEIESKKTKIRNNIGGIVTSLLFNWYTLDDALEGEVAQTINHKLSVDDNTIADIQYYQFLESGIGGFTTDYEVAINASIHGRYPLHIQDTDKGNVDKFRRNDMSYNYASPNLNTSSGYLYVSNDFWEFYLTKEEINKLLLEEEEYNKCIKIEGPSFGQNTNKCGNSPSKNVKNRKYYDVFRQYTTTSGILQYMINEHIDKVIDEIK